MPFIIAIIGSFTPGIARHPVVLQLLQLFAALFCGVILIICYAVGIYSYITPVWLVLLPVLIILDGRSGNVTLF